MKITATIKGLTPIMMDRFTDEAAEQISGGSSPVSTGQKRSPRDQATRSAYRDDKTGVLFVPGPNIFAALINAGKFHKVGKNKVTTAKSSLVPAGIVVEDLVCEIFDPDKPRTPIKDFEVDSRRVQNALGQAIMKHRARIDSWQLTFNMDVDEEVFSEAFCRVLVADAGKKIGIGSFRPERRGPFGRFSVVGWKVEGQEKDAKAA